MTTKPERRATYKSIIDWRGRTVRVGDEVAYPVSQSSSAGITVGRVLDIFTVVKYDREQPRIVIEPTETTSPYYGRARRKRLGGGYDIHGTKPVTLHQWDTVTKL